MLLVAVSLLIGSVSCFYSTGDSVVVLNPANFDDKVMNSDSIWVVEFYAPWCGHCKALTPEWKKAGKALKGIVQIGAADVDQHKELGSKFGIQGFPTIKIFAGNKNKPVDYKGPRTAAGVIQEALRLATVLANDRLAGKGDSSSGGKSGGKSGGNKKGNPADVVELTSSIFNKEVLDSKDMWLVEFYAPWCGHCKKLAPEWASAATSLKGKVKLGAVDATQFGDLAQRYGVKGYPTIKYFPAGAKLDAEEYDGGRTAGDIVSWAEAKLEVFAEPPEIRELLNDEMFAEECREKGICLISILPDILDTGAEGRNNYLTTLKELGDKYKKRKWGWAWSFAGEQDKLEAAIEVGGAGYPTIVALNIKKNAVLHHRGGFSKDSINEFLQYVIAGRIAPAVLRKDVPKLRKATPWDGKDGQMPEEEDYSDLDDVDLDDIPVDEEGSGHSEL
ncbi:protein disulfide-isomerase A6 homolog [Bolinopsis microptera]|uniref:protein disulfide-isomerase A6 homolog n=1 Tax=Bolinopsis microptera TaxID=2820187 RepID=UPI00307A8C5F